MSRRKGKGDRKGDRMERKRNGIIPSQTAFGRYITEIHFAPRTNIHVIECLTCDILA